LVVLAALLHSVASTLPRRSKLRLPRDTS
jgi:hypothetical protein